MNNLKTSTIVIIVGIVVLALLFIWGIKTYNGIVTREEQVSTAWSNVETQYQRRADLIPNLVKVVKGYATFERGTLTDVINARAKATQITVDADNLTPEKLQTYQKAQGDVTTALGKLMAITENYPELKANENFSELQAQLEGTENRISETRKQFNITVQDYNIKIRRIPGSLIAAICGFQTKAKFEAATGTQQAPTVDL